MRSVINQSQFYKLRFINIESKEILTEHAVPIPL